MSSIIRAQYRAAVREQLDQKEQDEWSSWLTRCQTVAQEKVQNGELLTCAMCQYQSMLFLYMEYIVPDNFESEHKLVSESEPELVAKVVPQYADLPDQWFAPASDILRTWPQRDRDRYFSYMYPVFWSDEPVSLEQWKRKQKPDARCGRIAVLYPDKLFSYVCHHQALVQEGLLVGDRYQMISLHENILFSYFETPRDRERVNIRRSTRESEEIKAWEAVDPYSHFYHFPEANGENFMIIPTLFSVG